MALCVSQLWLGLITTLLCHENPAYALPSNPRSFVVVTNDPHGPSYAVGKESCFSHLPGSAAEGVLAIVQSLVWMREVTGSGGRPGRTLFWCVTGLDKPNRCRTACLSICLHFSAALAVSQWHARREPGSHFKQVFRAWPCAISPAMESECVRCDLEGPEL